MWACGGVGESLLEEHQQRVAGKDGRRHRLVERLQRKEGEGGGGRGRGSAKRQDGSSTSRRTAAVSENGQREEGRRGTCAPVQPGRPGEGLGVRGGQARYCIARFVTVNLRRQRED